MAMKVYCCPILKPIRIVNKNVITIIKKSKEASYRHMSRVFSLKKQIHQLIILGVEIDCDLMIKILWKGLGLLRV